MTDNMFSGLESLGTDACSTFLQNLPISGAAISVFVGHASELTIGASDGLSARLDELQIDLGEGPRWEAMRTRTPILIPNVKSAEHAAWPVFAKSLLELNVSAFFTFPLMLGAVDLGVVELYNLNPGLLTPSDNSTVLRLADSLAWKILKHVLTADSLDHLAAVPEDTFFPRREIHQATGMVLAQTGATATDALLLLRAHAFTQGISVHETARAVVTKKLDFTPPRTIL